MKVLGEDWFAIVMFLDGKSGSKPILQIYTSSGKLVVQQIWKDAPALKVGWSINEELLVVQKNGFITVLDLKGRYLRRFSMGPEAEGREIIDVRFFTIDNNTGIAILTGGKHFFLTTSIDTPRMRRLAEIPTSSYPLSTWQIITAALEPNSSGISDSFRGPWALIGRKRTLFRIDFGTVETIELSKIAKTSCTDIISISVSANMQFVAIYLNNGELLISNIRLTELHSHIDLTERISVMLSSSDDLSDHLINHPQTMLWSTTSAVVLKWDHLIAIVGALADIYESFYPDDMFLTQEVDGVRIISSTSHDFIQRVPPALESLGRIGASCPATWLVSASKSLMTKTGRVIDYLLPIKHANQMIEAISHCIEAASHSVFDSVCQQELLQAACMGRTFLSAMFTTSDNCAPVGKVKELADQAAQVCQTLRLLNNLAAPFIGFALTWRQLQALGPNRLFERLLTRHHYPMAIELVRIDQKHQWPKSIGIRDQTNENVCTLTRLLAHWACNSAVTASESASVISDRVEDLVRKLYCNKSTSKSLEGTFCGKSRATLYKTSNSLELNFAEVANKALVAGRDTAAEQILDYELCAGRQVPLLLKLCRYNRALVRAVETGDPELITRVVVALQNQAKLPPADLAMALRKHPIALAIYQENWGQIDELNSSDSRNSTQAALLSFRQENDRVAEAKKAVLNAYKETNLASRLTFLQNGEEIYRQMKQDFMAQECNAAIRLLRFQSKLEKQEIRAPIFEDPIYPQNLETWIHDPYYPLIVPPVAPSSANEKLWVGKSLNTTLGRLLASSQGERQADQLRREFRVSEKRFAFLRLIGMCIRNESWLEMDKMIGTRKPIVNLEMLIKICIDGNHVEDAIKLIPRLPSERRVQFWLLCGKLEQAKQASMKEPSDKDLMQIKQYLDAVSTLNQRIQNS